MKKTLKFWSWLLALGILASSCYKDLGNYDYVELDEITIDTAGRGILADYAVFRYDTLRIDPRVLLNGQEISSAAQAGDKLAFTWSIFQATTGGTVHTRDTLSHELTLAAPIVKPAGQWVVVLSVKNQETGVETYQRFSVQVDEVLSDGWMVLYEKDGNTDVGLIVDDWSKRGVVQPRTFTDLIRSSNGQPLLGAPRALLHSASALATAEVLVASAQDMVAVDRSSFQIVYPFEKLFWSPPAKGEVGYFSTNLARKELVIHNNRVHMTNFASSGTARINYFGAAYLGDYGDLADWTPSFFGQAADAIVYDQTAKHFLYVPINGSTFQSFPPQSEALTKFDVNNVGLDLEAFDWGWQNMEYMAMKDANAHYLLASNFMLPQLDRLGAGKYEISGIPAGTSITTMASAAAGQYVLLGTANQVHLFKYNTGQPAEVEWTAPAGETITCVRIQKFYHAQLQAILLPMTNRVVYIATWNESTKEGKVYSYLIDPTNGTIDRSSERVATGFGKIKDMSYKWQL